MIELKEKRFLLSAFILITIVFTLNFSLSILPYLPSETDIKNSKDSIYIKNSEIKLNTSGRYMRNTGLNALKLTPLEISGSIYSETNASLNYLFDSTSIINLWVIINSSSYKASEIEYIGSIDTLFTSNIYHENILSDIEDSATQLILNMYEFMIKVIIQFGEIGQGQLLKSEAFIITLLNIS